MSVTVACWRIAADTPDYEAHELTGKGAEKDGGRWNRKGIPIVYASQSIALACLESMVHLNVNGLPLNRYLVKILVPIVAWNKRTVFDPKSHVGWDAEPAGKVSIDWGSLWVDSATTLIAEVPSVIIPEEHNWLINPRHPDAGAITSTKLRKWAFDARL